MRKSFSSLRHEQLESRNLLHGGAAGEPLPDFALVDVNDTSPTHAQTVSLADYSGTRAVYFTRST